MVHKYPFITTLSAFTQVVFLDIRPLQISIPVNCLAGDILNLPFASNSVPSLSCLHVAEHIGLGRYGDNLNPLGTILACKELERVLLPGGNLYFSIPIGRQGVYFNAHEFMIPKK